jgi:N-acetylneuraminic acid mutarotase
LYRYAPAADAWQRTWVEARGRLPGGGNHDIFATPCQGRLYVAGGWAGQWGLPVRDHVPDVLLAYDPRTECWEAVSRMYMPRRYSGIATLDGRVWVVGGETRFAGRGGPHQALDLVDVYDPSSGTWTTGPSLNHVRTDPFVVACDGRLWAIGGARHNGGPKLDTVESLGPGEGAWREETPLPQPTRQGHACVLDHVIYCFSIDGAFAYDSRSGRWDEQVPQPGQIGQGPLAAAWQGQVWLIGGYNDQRIRCFDPATRTWSAGPDLPTEQAWAAAAVLDGRLYVVGGAHYSKGHAAIVFDDRVFVLRATT